VVACDGHVDRRLQHWALVPKANSMLASDTPAEAAIARMVVAAYPQRVKCFLAVAVASAACFWAWPVPCDPNQSRRPLSSSG
jgi:hypothetical protein